MQSHLIVVGKLKDQHISAIENDYLKRLKVPFHIHEVKAHGDNLEKEEKEITEKIKALNKHAQTKLVLLTEKGKHLDSHEFAKFIDDAKMNSLTLIFIIGGALGFRKSFKEQANDTLSLSALTFPHRLARLIFIEQFYRAQTIIEGHPYNH